MCLAELGAISAGNNFALGGKDIKGRWAMVMCVCTCYKERGQRAADKSEQRLGRIKGGEEREEGTFPAAHGFSASLSRKYKTDLDDRLLVISIAFSPP